MSTVWRWLSRVLIALLALLLLLTSVWSYGRLSSPTDAQREAVAVMQAQPPLPEGDNGFDLLMALPSQPDAKWLTSLQCDEASSCVDAVQSAPEANAAALEAWRPRLEAAARALRAPTYRDKREHVSGTESITAFQDVTNLTRLRALQFAAGQSEQALGNACTDTLGAARWAVEPDNVLHAMIGIAIFRQQAALIADMRSRAPAETLPASCTALAQEPDTAIEGSFCNAMRGEWRYQQRMLPSLMSEMEQQSSTFERLKTNVVHDSDWMAATTAQAFFGACTEEARHATRGDRVHRVMPPKLRWVDRVAYPASSILLGISMPAYGDYFELQLDHVARRRLLAAWLQMSAMDPALTSQQRFDALPASVRDGPRPLVLAADGSALTVPIRGRRGEDQEPMGARLPLAQAPSAVPTTLTEPATVP